MTLKKVKIRWLQSPHKGFGPINWNSWRGPWKRRWSEPFFKKIHSEKFDISWWVKFFFLNYSKILLRMFKAQRKYRNLKLLNHYFNLFSVCLSVPPSLFHKSAFHLILSYLYYKYLLYYKYCLGFFQDISIISTVRTGKKVCTVSVLLSNY